MRKRTHRSKRPATILFPGALTAIGLALVATPALTPALAAPDHGRHRYEQRHDGHDRYRDEHRHGHRDHSNRAWKHHRDHRYRGGHGHSKWGRDHRHYPHARHARYERFVVPNRLVHGHGRYEPYFHGRFYDRGHRHHHDVYRFPVYTDHGWRHRLHYYCGEDLYTTGSFLIRGDRFSFGFTW